MARAGLDDVKEVVAGGEATHHGESSFGRQAVVAAGDGASAAGDAGIDAAFGVDFEDAVREGDVDVTLGIAGEALRADDGSLDGGTANTVVRLADDVDGLVGGQGLRAQRRSEHNKSKKTHT